MHASSRNLHDIDSLCCVHGWVTRNPTPSSFRSGVAVSLSLLIDKFPFVRAMSEAWSKKKRRSQVLEKARAAKRRVGDQETSFSNESVVSSESAGEIEMSVDVNMDGDLETEEVEQVEVSLEDAQQAVDDWVLSMNQSDRRMLAMLVFVTLRTRQKFS